MRHLLQYRPRMQSRASLAFFLILAFALTASAQINGAPASVTSYGFGGHAYPNAPRASVTSLGPNGYGSRPLPAYQGPRITSAPVGNPNRDGHHHGHTYPYYPSYYPYYPVIDPYTYGNVYAGPADTGAVAEEDPEQYQGGPTIFDRRGSGQLYPNDYDRQRALAPADAAPSIATRAPSASQTEAPPESPQPPTVLVFKDGHKEEVTNYAIVGSNLFDLSSARRQKIPIADLDVAATQKANEDQGIEFKLPAPPTGS
jgi:hypothetical protein